MESKLLSLPLELFEIIFKQLPRPAQASLVFSCKGLFQLCESQPSWMHRLWCSIITMASLLGQLLSIASSPPRALRLHPLNTLCSQQILLFLPSPFPQKLFPTLLSSSSPTVSSTKWWTSLVASLIAQFPSPTHVLHLLTSFIDIHPASTSILHRVTFSIEEPRLLSRDSLVYRSTYSSGFRRNLADDELMEFLMQHESERWVYCISCFKLHPPSEFEETSLQGSARERSWKWLSVILFPRYVTLRSDLSICRDCRTDSGDAVFDRVISNIGQLRNAKQRDDGLHNELSETVDLQVALPAEVSKHLVFMPRNPSHQLWEKLEAIRYDRTGYWLDHSEPRRAHTQAIAQQVHEQSSPQLPNPPAMVL